MNSVTDKGLATTASAGLSGGLRSDQVSGMPDVQGEPDRRNLAIDRVGVRGLRYPVLVQANGQAQPSVAEFELLWSKGDPHVPLRGATRVHE